MTRRALDTGLQEITDDLLELAGMVSRAVRRSVECVASHDRDFAGRIVAEDALVNEKRFQTEHHCLEVLALQQPEARDLRWVVAMLMISVDLERMGDYAAGIAGVVLKQAEPLAEAPYAELERMMEVATRMLDESLAAFTSHDVERARAIAHEDDTVDALCEQVYAALLRYMTANPHSVDKATQYMWIARYLERMADRVLNICERVIYVVEGENEEFHSDRPR